MEPGNADGAAEFGGVEAALERIHTPEFGLCADCGADIPYSRLQAAPFTRRCLGCQAKAEKAAPRQAAAP